MAVMVRTLMSRLQRLDPVLEQAPANLRATRWQTFRTVTFPLLLPAILAGAVFTFIEVSTTSRSPSSPMATATGPCRWNC
jgi:putative spermidine/putrescine transport system permease protein